MTPADRDNIDRDNIGRDNIGRDSIGEQLSAYLDGELSAAQRTEVEALLQSDPQAQALLATLKEAADQVQSLPRGSAPASILEDLTARLERDDLLGSPADDVTLGRHGRRPVGPLLAMAAVLVMAVGVSLWALLPNLSRARHAAAPPRSRPEENLRSIAKSHEAYSARGSQAGEDPLERLFARADESAGDRGAGELIRRLDVPKPADAKSKVTGGSAEVADADVALGETVVHSFDSSTPQTPPEEVRKAGRLRDSVAVDLLSAGERGGQVVVAPDEMTLEQKLAAGMDVAAVAKHRFANEPLQLKVAFADSKGQATFNKTLVTFFDANDLVPLAQVVNARGDDRHSEGKSDSNDDGYGIELGFLPPGVGGRIADEQTMLYFSGGSPDNFAVDDDENQYIVRIGPAAFAELIDSVLPTSEEIEQVELNVGMLRARGLPDVTSVARGALGETPIARRLGAAHEKDEDREPEAFPAFGWAWGDLEAWLERAGLFDDVDTRRRGSGVDEARSKQRLGGSEDLAKSRDRDRDRKLAAGKKLSQDAGIKHADADGVRDDIEPLLTLVIQLLPARQPPAEVPASQPATEPVTTPTTTPTTMPTTVPAT